jgi:hypothetical protein
MIRILSRILLSENILKNLIANLPNAGIGAIRSAESGLEAVKHIS